MRKFYPQPPGELRPPLGKRRLIKNVEFIAVLLRTANEIAEKELVSSGAIQRILVFFFEYPYNNSLHHHEESIILSCLESIGKMPEDSSSWTNLQEHQLLNQSMHCRKLREPWKMEKKWEDYTPKEWVEKYSSPHGQSIVRLI